jgi:hypothetical protein
MAPKQPYRALRAGFGAVLLALVVGLWAHGQLAGEPMGTLWELVILALVLAGGYSVFGEQTMTSAVDTAQDLQGGGDQEGDDG